MKYIKIAASLILIAALAISLISCTKGGAPEKTLDGTYIRGTTGDYFSITFSKDGTFEYSESLSGDHSGKGTYTYEDGYFILRDESPHGPKEKDKTYRFKLSGGVLYFFITGSDNFSYSPLPDGAAFAEVGIE